MKPDANDRAQSGARLDLTDEQVRDAERHALPPKTLPANDRPWPDPEPFGALDLPVFPVAALSSWLRDWAIAEAEFCQVPVDLPSVVCLGCAGLAASRGIDVEVRDGWTEPTNIWTVSSAPPGERKSPVFAAATRPIMAYQAAAAERLQPQVFESASQRRILESKIKEAEAACVKGKLYGGQSARTSANDLHAELVALRDVTAPVLLSDDVTTEAVAKLLAENNEQLGIFSAEGGGPFDVMGGRYSEGANFDIFLKAHAGDTHIVHRIKRQSILLTRPLLSMALTVQPSVIGGLATRESFRGRGLLARFLYSLPRSLVGARSTDPDKVPDEARKAYGAALIELLSKCNGSRRKLTMSPGADEARRQYQRALEPRLGPDGDLCPIADWAAKLVGLVARVAGILHTADHAFDLGAMPLVIPVETWLRAQAIGDYALAHARHAFDVMGSDEIDADAKRLWGWICRKGRTEFSQRDAMRALNAEATEQTLAAIARVEQRDLVRVRLAPPSGGKGRPASPTYEVNPRAVIA